jgi:hypothetical protein
LREQSPLHCSFCNKGQNDVRRLIAGPGVNICDECVDTCADIMAGAPGTADTRDATAVAANGTGQLLGRMCALCRFPLLLEEALAVDQRGFICRGCIDAIEAAVASRKLAD